MYLGVRDLPMKMVTFLRTNHFFLSIFEVKIYPAILSDRTTTSYSNKYNNVYFCASSRQTEREKKKREKGNHVKTSIDMGEGRWLCGYCTWCRGKSHPQLWNSIRSLRGLVRQHNPGHVEIPWVIMKKICKRIKKNTLVSNSPGLLIIRAILGGGLCT